MENLAVEELKTSGLNLVELNKLPNSQRQLINWMRRQKNCSLQEVATEMGEDEATARNLLDNLLEKGFVREIVGENGSCYRVNIGTKRGRKLPLKLQQALDEKKVF
jgi:DNA-binding MarR family transcriptional regulator